MKLKDQEGNEFKAGQKIVVNLDQQVITALIHSTEIGGMVLNADPRTGVQVVTPHRIYAIIELKGDPRGDKFPGIWVIEQPQENIPQ